MNISLFKSEPKFIESCRTALSNVDSHHDIKAVINSFGMDETKIAEGWVIYNNAVDIWEHYKKENTESKIASNSYRATYSNLRLLYRKHRYFTLIFFKKQPDIIVRLGIKDSYPAKYKDFFEKVKLFYETISSTPAIQTEMTKIKITSEVVTSALAMYEALIKDQTNYEKDLNESQDPTKSKNAALLALKEWMDDFDAIAKIALHDKPELLESLGIFVRC